MLFRSAVRLRHPMRTAVVPVGYADGLGLAIDHAPKSLLQKAGEWAKQKIKVMLYRLGLAGSMSIAISPVTYQGISLPIVGRLSMQQVVVEIGDLPLETGAVVELNARRSTVNPRLARLFLRAGKPYRIRSLAGSYELQGSEQSIQPSARDAGKMRKAVW